MASIDEWRARWSNRRYFYELREYGIWVVYGEDPNPDWGGHHYEPIIGYYRGTYKQVKLVALNHPSFFEWGAGGRIQKINIIELVD